MRQERIGRTFFLERETWDKSRHVEDAIETQKMWDIWYREEVIEPHGRMYINKNILSYKR